MVEEIPAYEPSGDGEHLYLWIEKIGLNTLDVAKRLAQAGEVKERDIGYAGMKDKHAVTRQWFSVLGNHATAGEWNLGEGARILSVTRHNNKLRTGHLIGNRFELTLIDLGSDDHRRAEALALELTTRGFLNAYGGQRFGFGGKNLEQARRWLDQNTKASHAAQAQPDSAQTGTERRRKKPNRFENKLHPSVLQSEFFNRYASARLELDTELLPGEVVRLKGTGTHFVIEDISRELPRKLAGDLILTGPMPGNKTLRARDRAAEVEQRVWEELGLSPHQAQTLCSLVPGARRDLLVVPDDLRCSSRDGSLILKFSLPAGSYATELLRQFNGCDWLNPRPRASD